MRNSQNLSATNKKLIALYAAFVILFAVAFGFHKGYHTPVTLMALLGAAIPFLATSSFFAWQGKAHLEEHYSDDSFLQVIHQILSKLWWALGLACGASVLALLWVFLQYRSGNLIV